MKDQKDPLGDRMKEQYENRTRFMLPRRTYTIMRLDGRAFHTLTRGMDKPFDEAFAAGMNRVAMKLLTEVSGSVFGYIQSDEISLLLQDFEQTGTQPWFGGNIQKMTSVAAGIASKEFPFAGGVFDCRVFTIPEPVEVANYFIWRQRDAQRNSILMLAQYHLGHKACQGLNTSELRLKLLLDKDVNWNALYLGHRNGYAVHRELVRVEVEHPGAPQFDGPALRTRVRLSATDQFTCEPDGWLASMIPPLPTLRA